MKIIWDNSIRLNMIATILSILKDIFTFRLTARISQNANYTSPFMDASRITRQFKSSMLDTEDITKLQRQTI